MSTLLDTNDSFTYLWYLWRLVGIYPYSKLKWFYNTYSIVVNLLASVLSPLSVAINPFFVQDIELFMSCLQFSPTLLASSAKQIVMFFRLPRLQNVKTYLNQLDRRASRNKEEVQYLENVIKQCRCFVLTIMVSFVVSLSTYAISGLIKRKLIFDGWFPFDWTSSEARYLSAFMFQFLSTCFQIMQNGASDGYSVMHMIVIKAHIHVLCTRIARIGRDPIMTPNENYEELKSCIKDHQTIISLFEDIKPTVGLTVLLQFCISAFLLCVTAINFLIFDRGIGGFINTFIYASAILAEVFPVCYFGNLLMSETDGLTTAIYSCNWMDQPKKFRKCIVIFMQRSQKNYPILAGGLIPITLQTFIDIIRFSFSLYTLLSEMQ